MAWFFFSFFSLFLLVALYLSTFLFRPARHIVIWFASLFAFSYPMQTIIVTALGLGIQFFMMDMTLKSHIAWTAINAFLSVVLIMIHLRPIFWYLFNFDFMDFNIQGIFPVKGFRPHMPRLTWLLKINRVSWKNRATGTFPSRDGSQLGWDLWKTSDPKAPTIIQLFGGGYTIGSKEQLPHFIRMLVECGYNVICPNYRLMPNHVWPTPLDDMMDFWKYLPEIMKSQGLDPAFFVMSGRSAGSHLASQFITQIKEPKIKGYINLYGPQNWHDLLRFSHHGDILDSPKQMKMFYGRDVHEDSAILKEVSPYFAVTENFPKTLNLHGLCDCLVPADQTRIWTKKLESLNVPHATYYFPYATHVFDWSLYSPAGATSAYLIKHFLIHLMQTENSKRA